MAHSERPIIPIRKYVCVHCGQGIKIHEERSWRLADGRFLHLRCYVPFKRIR